jgi:sec-independent protein translocase protein TatB
MFSIGFAELLVIAVITLLVVGPERLPETIRFISLHLAKFRRYWQGARRDIEKELGLDDLRREIHNAEVIEHLKETKKALNKSLTADPEQEKTGILPLSETSSTPIEKAKESLEAQNSILDDSKLPATGKLFTASDLDSAAGSAAGSAAETKA